MSFQVTTDDMFDFCGSLSSRHTFKVLIAMYLSYADNQSYISPHFQQSDVSNGFLVSISLSTRILDYKHQITFLDVWTKKGFLWRWYMGLCKWEEAGRLDLKNRHKTRRLLENRNNLARQPLSLLHAAYH